MGKLRVGDEITGFTKEQMRALPEGIILESNSETFALVAYRAAEIGWTITGHGKVENNAYMANIPVRWIVRHVP